MKNLELRYQTKENKKGQKYNHICFYYKSVFLHKIKRSSVYLSGFGFRYKFENPTTDGKSIYVDKIPTIYTKKKKTKRVKYPLPESAKIYLNKKV
ncbi:MAG: hypothetical protein GY849_02320 [Deltaproteobacteria bacterium]|nr:hypothetical protein [Deltaproteobacteria bacterium]